MYEIRFHGRGGQGAVTAANLLAVAAFKEGKDVQAFPIFGVERRGAPVAAFLRMDENPIDIKTQIYEPDAVVVLDPTLLEVVDVSSGLKEGGPIIINSAKDPGSFCFSNGRVACVDATKIAVDLGLGTVTSPIVNTAILGAVSAALGNVGMEAIHAAIDEMVPIKKEENKKAATQASQAVNKWGENRPEDAGEGGACTEQTAPTCTEITMGACNVNPGCAEVYKTGTWRTLKPVVDDEKCRQCWVCIKYCPDSSIAEGEESIIIDMDHCKGCGICAYECKFDAIEMVLEEK